MPYRTPELPPNYRLEREGCLIFVIIDDGYPRRLREHGKYKYFRNIYHAAIYAWKHAYTQLKERGR